MEEIINTMRKQVQTLYTYLGQLERHITDTSSTLDAMKSDKQKVLAEVSALEDFLTKITDNNSQSISTDDTGGT